MKTYEFFTPKTSMIVQNENISQALVDFRLRYGHDDIIAIVDLKLEAELRITSKEVPFKWVSFIFGTTNPPKYGKYLICRRDGKIHWETWNGNGWAYNHDEIRYWAEIVAPLILRKTLK
ncbi:MAG: hypothetical protein JXR34_10635 [Bacteroidales bacterium]|nr:hypothetical protein [Bacteroidales bacterium]